MWLWMNEYNILTLDTTTTHPYWPREVKTPHRARTTIHSFTTKQNLFPNSIDQVQHTCAYVLSNHLLAPRRRLIWNLHIRLAVINIPITLQNFTLRIHQAKLLRIYYSVTALISAAHVLFELLFRILPLSMAIFEQISDRMHNNLHYCWVVGGVIP